MGLRWRWVDLRARGGSLAASVPPASGAGHSRPQPETGHGSPPCSFVSAEQVPPPPPPLRAPLGPGRTNEDTTGDRDRSVDEVTRGRSIGRWAGGVEGRRSRFDPSCLCDLPVVGLSCDEAIVRSITGPRARAVPATGKAVIRAWDESKGWGRTAQAAPVRWVRVSVGHVLEARPTSGTHPD